MARSQGRLLARIWSDVNFRALTGNAQRAYALLISQSNLTQAGTIPLTTRRWASMASDTSEPDIVAALRELESTRFVVIDGTTEELLVRTLIRNDGVYKQPKIFKAAKSDAEAVSSRKLRRALLTELQALEVENAEVKKDCAALIEALTDPEPDPPERVTDTLSEGYGLPNGKPPRARALAPTPTPTPTPTAHLPVPALREPAPTVNQRAKPLVQAYYDRLKGMCKWPAILGIVKKAINTEEWSDEEIHDALMRLADESRTLTVDSLRIELVGLAPQTRPRVNPADERLHHGQGVVLSLRQREKHQTREIS